MYLQEPLNYAQVAFFCRPPKRVVTVCSGVHKRHLQEPVNHVQVTVCRSPPKRVVVSCSRVHTRYLQEPLNYVQVAKLCRTLNCVVTVCSGVHKRHLQEPVNHCDVTILRRAPDCEDRHDVRAVLELLLVGGHDQLHVAALDVHLGEAAWRRQGAGGELGTHTRVCNRGRLCVPARLLRPLSQKSQKSRKLFAERHKRALDSGGRESMASFFLSLVRRIPLWYKGVVLIAILRQKIVGLKGVRRTCEFLVHKPFIERVCCVSNLCAGVAVAAPHAPLNAGGWGRRPGPAARACSSACRGSGWRHCWFAGGAPAAGTPRGQSGA